MSHFWGSHSATEWDRHIEAIAPKCYAVIASLRLLRQVGIPLRGLLAVYNSLVIPLLTYAFAVWGGGYLAKSPCHSE